MFSAPIGSLTKQILVHPPGSWDSPDCRVVVHPSPQALTPVMRNVLAPDLFPLAKALQVESAVEAAGWAWRGVWQ